MDVRINERCNPCRCPQRTSTPSHYFYVEKTPVNDSLSKNKSSSRPSSANSAKSSHSSKKTLSSSSKLPSSDSKLSKRSVVTRTRVRSLKNREEDKKSKNECQNVEQLKEDLQTIKEQLFALTKNRNEALNVTNELENRYTCLLNKSLHQEKEIQALKCQNAKLLAKCQCQKSLEGTEIDEVETTKLCLDQYESKLNELYKEFLNTSKVMEQSRDKVCRCIKDKHSEFEKIAASKKVLSKMIEDNDAKYTNLLKNYQQLKETERKQKEENEMLSRKVEDLESQLQETSMELEMSREEAMSIAKNQQEEMDDKSKCYTYELQLKAKEIGELNSAVEELRTHICECNKQTTANNLLQTKYDELAHKYKHMLDTVNTYERNNMKRLEEIQALKRNVKDLVGKLVNLQNFAAEMTNMLNQSNLSISELSRSNEEKESIIQCQKIELASKDKQIELLVLNEDRLKKKAAQLQEDLVGMRITSCPNKQNRNAVLCADDCSMDELHELITALYEEIDKSLTKDDKIQQQKRNICCLKCNLSSKENELSCVRNELKILREQFAATLKEKHALADHLKKVQYAEPEEDGVIEEYYEETIRKKQTFNTLN